MLHNNPGTSDALARMAEIFRDEVASSYGEDWLLRSVASNYLPAHVMSPPSSPIKVQGQRTTSSTPKTRMEHPPSPTLSTVSSATSLTESTITGIEEDAPPPKVKVRRARTVIQSKSVAAPSAMHGIKPSASFTPPVDGGPGSLPHQQLPAMLTLSSTVTLSSTMASCTISKVSGSRLPNDVEEFMADIGKGGTDERELVRDIYLYTGRALWESSIMGRIGISSGSAKALVGLMSNIT